MAVDKQTLSSEQVLNEMNQLSKAAGEKKWIRKTPLELAFQLAATGSFTMGQDEGLILSQMDMADFIDAANAAGLQNKMQVFLNILSRYSSALKIEGSIAIGQLNISDLSWVLLPGDSGSFTITLQPPLLKRSIDDMASFLSLLPQGQAFILKPGSDLLLERLSSESMLAYYEHCTAHTDPKERDKGQDQLFEKNCPMLAQKGWSLKIFGANAVQVDRHIDAKAGGIFFRAIAKDKELPAALALVLMQKKD